MKKIFIILLVCSSAAYPQRPTVSPSDPYIYFGYCQALQNKMEPYIQSLEASNAALTKQIADLQKQLTEAQDKYPDLKPADDKKQ